MRLSAKFEEALQYTASLHREQERKGSGVPYLAHLLGTASIALQYGADEEQAITALLHDAVEDQGGLEQLEQIREYFGERVAEIVAGCTDAWAQPKPPWKQRKQDYLDKLPEKSADILLVSCADKLFNARAILQDYREVGEELWQRFSGGKEGTLWYYRELAERFTQCFSGALSLELRRTISALDELVSKEI